MARSVCIRCQVARRRGVFALGGSDKYGLRNLQTAGGDDPPQSDRRWCRGAQPISVERVLKPPTPPWDAAWGPRGRPGASIAVAIQLLEGLMGLAPWATL